MPFTPKNWQDRPSTVTPITAAALEDLETRVTDYADELPFGGDGTVFMRRDRSGLFNVKDYGATGDATTDDTVSIQAAIDAAIDAQGAAALIGSGTVFFPPGTYRVTDTLIIEPTGAADRVQVNLEGSLGWPDISWDGADSTPVIHSRGWKQSRIKGINIVLAATADNVVAWEIDDDVTYASSSYLAFEGCHVAFQTGASNNIGWRMGQGGGADQSFHTWTNCTVFTGAVDGHQGWVWEHANCLAFTWTSCYCGYMTIGWSGLSTAGENNGGGGMVWNGCGSSFNALDFRFARAGSYVINGGRYEVGTAFLNCELGDTPSATVELVGVEIADYATTGAVITGKGSIGLALRGVIAYQNTALYHAQFITNYGAGGFASLVVENCRLAVSASGWYYFPNGTPNVSLAGNVRLGVGDMAGVAQLGFPIPSVASAATVTLGPEPVQTITGTTTITSVTAGEVGRVVTLVFAGVLTFTDGSNLKLNGNFVTSADDTITLVSDGTNWIETARSAN